VIPLKDNLPTLRRPVVTWALIAVNVIVFLYSIGQTTRTLPDYQGEATVAVAGFDEITLEYGFVPCELARSCAHPDLGDASVAGGDGSTAQVRVPEQPAWLTLLTAMFMHGGWLHIAGNMLFLWIFGNNVEDAMGRVRFLVFYLFCGLAASLTQFVIDTGSQVPNIGASGAIAGVLGGYVLLYPKARVLTAITLLVFFYVVEIPAVFVLLAWFALQVLDGSAALVAPGQSFGVAYFAHIGGFVAGAALVRAFARRRRPPPGVLPLYG